MSLRKPEGVALNRGFELNKTSVEFNIDCETQFAAASIYNRDESGLSRVHKPRKVLSTQGKKVVASATSGERGVTTTIICCYNAAGNYILPMMIFKRKLIKPELIDHVPNGTIGA